MVLFYLVQNILREILIFFIYDRFSDALGSKNSMILQTGDINLKYD